MLADVAVNVVHTFGFGSCEIVAQELPFQSAASKLVLPVIVTSKAVRNGEELVCFLEPPTETGASSAAKEKRKKTWFEMKK